MPKKTKAPVEKPASKRRFLVEEEVTDKEKDVEIKDANEPVSEPEIAINEPVVTAAPEPVIVKAEEETPSTTESHEPTLTESQPEESEHSMLSPMPLDEPNEPIMEAEKKKGMSGPVVFIIGLVIGGLLGVGTVWGWSMIFGKPEVKTEKPQMINEVAPQPTEVVVAKTSPTPEALVLKRSDLKIRVENGSGISGAASVAGDYLTGLGYKVVSVGNSATNAKKATVSLVKAKSSFAAMLIKDLGSKYDVATVASELKNVVDYDALVTIEK